jgi:hypothetical protein
MKLSNPSQKSRIGIHGDSSSGYETAHQGALNILGKGRPTAAWSRVSPTVLGEIDHYVHALARRQ